MGIALLQLGFHRRLQFIQWVSGPGAEIPAGAPATAPATTTFLYPAPPGPASTALAGFPAGGPAAAPGYPLTNGLGTAGMVLGIIGAISGVVPFFFFVAWALGILALVFGLLGRSRAKKLPVPVNRGRSTAAVVLGLAALGMGAIGYSILNNAFNDLESDLETAGSGSVENPAQEDVSITGCALGGSGDVAVNGKILNHSSERSNYWVSVNVVDSAGTKVGDTSAIQNNIAAGQEGLWDATAFVATSFQGGAVQCQVAEVTRLSAE